jgi:hypothetical protein
MGSIERLRKNGRRKGLRKPGKNIFMDSGRGSAKIARESYVLSVEHRSTIPWAQTFCMTMAAVRIVRVFRSTAGAAIQIVNIIENGIGTSKPNVIHLKKIILYFDSRADPV